MAIVSPFVTFNGFDNLPIVIRKSSIILFKQRKDGVEVSVSTGGGSDIWALGESLESIGQKMSSMEPAR
jgi:hypothetical protein